MKYYVEFPPSAGQYAGVHTFFSAKHRDAFMRKATQLGYVASEQWKGDKPCKN